MKNPLPKNLPVPKTSFVQVKLLNIENHLYKYPESTLALERLCPL